MNRAAYLTTELALKTLARLVKASTRFHGQELIPAGPLIFVINHFTRLETLLVPYYLYQLTGKPIYLLADDSLFHGPLKSYFDQVGVVSTRDPNRDALIVRTLVTSEANWIIFPEGMMVKDKKLLRGRRFMVGDGVQARAPHTGAAWLGLRAELVRRILFDGLDGRDGDSGWLRRRIGYDPAAQAIDPASVKLVPVNLTYYPIRARENFLSELAARYVDKPSERMIEELMTEGTMFLEGVDIDIRFGRPLDSADHLDQRPVRSLLARPTAATFDEDPALRDHLRDASRKMMRTYMERIYAATTVNHDHLLATLLRRRSFAPFKPAALARGAYLAAAALQRDPAIGATLHPSLRGDQLGLLSDDRQRRVASFVELGVVSGYLIETAGRLQKHRPGWPEAAPLHRARISNPSEVMANEIEPLQGVQKILARAARTPDWLARLRIGWHVYQDDLQRFRREREESGAAAEIDARFGAPFLLPARSRKIGVVLLHSYLSVPWEMKELALLLRKQGAWAYGARLPGHGTDPGQLARWTLEDWRAAAERAYVVISSLCDQVFLVGFSAGAMLALELASWLPDLSGVVAACPPYALQDYSPRFMPPPHIWNKLLARWRGSRENGEYVDFIPEHSEINYHRNPIAGVDQVDKLLAGARERLLQIAHPTLVIGSDHDLVVDFRGSERVYKKVGAARKELLRVTSSRHNIIYGNDSPQAAGVRSAICRFIAGAAR